MYSIATTGLCACVLTCNNLSVCLCIDLLVCARSHQGHPMGVCFRDCSQGCCFCSKGKQRCVNVAVLPILLRVRIDPSWVHISCLFTVAYICIKYICIPGPLLFRIAAQHAEISRHADEIEKETGNSCVYSIQDCLF